MVWWGIVGFRVIGPHFFDANVNAVTYGELLDQIPQYLDQAGVDANFRRTMWFLHDGAPPHRAAAVVNRLNQEYGDHWVGAGGPVAWPPYSPDENPCDTFLWGYVKDFVYARRPQNLDHLTQLIRDAFASITRQMIERTYSNYLMRQRLCIDVGGQHYEHIIKCHRCNPYL